MKKKKRRKNVPQVHRKNNRNATEPEHWEAYLNDPIALMQDGEYHLLHAWEVRNEEPTYGEDPLVLNRRQAAFWDFDRNNLDEVRYPDDYKVDDEEPDILDGDDLWDLGYRAGYVLKSWGPENDYDDYADWDDEDWPL
jgi:hypothetical protein